MLLGVPGARLEGLKEVRAHPQSLAQCRKLIKRLGLKRINHADNAGAADEVARLGDPSVAAIASSIAGAIYGLEGLEASLEDAAHSTTRFLIIERPGMVPQAGHRPSLHSLAFPGTTVPAHHYKPLD